MPEAVGMPIDRVDGRAKVTGAARYAADTAVKNAAYAVLVQSTVASGSVSSLDVARAQAAPGVLAIITHENAPKLNANAARGGMGESRIPLSDAKIHYAGQVIAVVVADTLERARSAARLVQATYAERPPKLPPADLAAGLDALEPQYKRGDVDAALADATQAAAVIREHYLTPIATHNPMEPSATVAEWEGDKLTLHDATQWLSGVQGVIATAFETEPANVRVICTALGGAFGCKAMIWPHQVLAAVAAKVVGRPVKLVLTRRQMFTACGYRPTNSQHVTIAATSDGKLSAIRHVGRGIGATLSQFGEAGGASSSRSVYACPNVAVAHDLDSYNIAPPTFMRGPGETPGMFALESALDELSYALKIDPLALRLKNLPDKHPASGRAWSSYHLKECLELGAEKIGWASRKPAPRASQSGDTLTGLGLAVAAFPGNRSGASAKITLSADGRLEVSSGTHDLGTGAGTIFTQVAADTLGLPLERVRFVWGDTSLPRAPMSAGSTTTATVSQAILEAGKQLKTKLIELALADAQSPLSGMTADDVEVAGGRVQVKFDETRGEAVEALVKRSGQEKLEADGRAAPNREALGQYAFYSFGAHFCEVQVDERLGRVRVTRFVSVADIGRVLNPKTARSQMMGGVVMGIGMALTEQTVLDPRDGRPVNSSFADYAIPVHADIRQVDAFFIDKPDPHINELGCRGVGELCITGVAAAVGNAVYHATGKRVRGLPITPDKLIG